jgi:zinc protease
MRKDRMVGFGVVLLLAASVAYAANVELGVPRDLGRGYAICVSRETLGDAKWKPVVEALQKKRQAEVIAYDGNPFPEDARRRLSRLMPRYTCFVARPEEVSTEFVVAANQMTRALDADPYGDTIWGVLTGYVPEDAIRQIEAPPLLIERGLLKTATDWLEDYLSAGIYHNEAKYGEMWVKDRGKVEKSNDGPVDDTPGLVEALNSNRYQLFVTSGHATEHDWQLHYPDRGKEGRFLHQDGRLYGLDAKGRRLDIRSSNPKVYYPAGNCLIAHIDRRDCMATSWLHTGGAVQMAGYVVPTWFGYMGWGVAEYFVKNPERFTFAESVYLTNQALLFDLEKKPAGSNPKGLTYDRDTFVLYGDPAYDARVKKSGPPLYEQTLTWEALSRPAGQYRFRLRVQTNTSATLSRPVVFFLPFRIKNPELPRVIPHAAVTDDLVVWTLPKAQEAGLPSKQSHLWEFTAEKQMLNDE